MESWPDEQPATVEQQQGSAIGAVPEQSQRRSTGGTISAAMWRAAGAHRKVLRSSLQRKGKRLAVEYTLAMLTSVGVGMLCVARFLVTDEACSAGLLFRLQLKNWFFVMAVLEGIAGTVFFFGHCTLVVLLSEQAARNRGITPAPALRSADDDCEDDGPPFSWRCVSASAVIIICCVVASMAWSIVGILCAIDPREADYGTCKIDRMAILCLSVLALVQSCFCQCCSIVDLHALELSRHREVPAPSVAGDEERAS